MLRYRVVYGVVSDSLYLLQRTANCNMPHKISVLVHHNPKKNLEQKYSTNTELYYPKPHHNTAPIGIT